MFERTDLPDSLPVRCSIRNVWTTGSIVSNIVLCSGSPHNYIRMAEHMIALRMGLGIDNLRIRIDSGDPPLFDRGSKELVEALDSAGRRGAGRPVPYVTVREKVTVSNGHGGFLTLVPAEAGNPSLELDVALAFRTAIGQQRIRFAVDPATFAYGATARTNASAGTVLFCRTLGWLFADAQLRQGARALRGAHLLGLLQERLVRGPPEVVRPGLHRDGRKPLHRQGRGEHGTALLPVFARKLSAAEALEAVRAHWGVETLHWVLDVVMDEDHSRTRTGHAPGNLAILRRLAVNILRRERDSGPPGRPPRRYRALRLATACDESFLDHLLAPAPSAETACA